MNIKIDGIGKLKNVSFDLNDITLIIGENNSGKSTIGKTVATVVNALSGAGENYFNDIKSETINKIVGGYHSLFRIRLAPISSTKLTGDLETYLQQISISNNFSELINSLNSLEKYLLLCDNDSNEMNKLIKTLPNFSNFTHNDFKENIRKFATLLTENKKNIEKITFDKYIDSFIDKAFNETFNKQIFPIKKDISEARVDFGSTSILISNNIHVTNLGKTPFKKAFLIGDANVLDDLNEFAQFEKFRIAFSNNIKFSFSLKNILLEALESNNKSVIDDVLGQETLNLLENIITSEFDNEEAIYKDGRYVLNKTGLDIRNLATGSKLSFILRQLIRNRFINQETILVLDEPESHLHPEWQTKIAELIVLLANKLKTKIIISTHSINILMGIIMYSKKYKGVRSSYYLIEECDENFSTLKNYTINYKKLISNLGQPFIRLNNEFAKIVDNDEK